MNTNNSFEIAYDFIEESSVTLPCLLDEDGSIYNSYPLIESYGPFPVHVVIGRDGVITYLSRQYDAEAVRAAITDALAQ